MWCLSNSGASTVLPLPLKMGTLGHHRVLREQGVLTLFLKCLILQLAQVFSYSPLGEYWANAPLTARELRNVSDAAVRKWWTGNTCSATGERFELWFSKQGLVGNMMLTATFTIMFLFWIKKTLLSQSH